MGRLRYHCLSGLLLLLALAAKAEEATTAAVPCDKMTMTRKNTSSVTSTEIFLTVFFIILVWISGKIAAALPAPVVSRRDTGRRDTRTPRRGLRALSFCS